MAYDLRASVEMSGPTGRCLWMNGPPSELGGPPYINGEIAIALLARLIESIGHHLLSPAGFGPL